MKLNALSRLFLEHKRPSSEVSNHVHIESPDHHIDLDEVQILDKEPRWFERGVKEAIYIKVNNPTLNKDGGGYKLPGVCESILRSSVPKVKKFPNFAKNPRNMRFWWGFWLIVKGNNYYNIHRKFQVHSTNIVVLGAKTNIARWQPPPSTPNFDSLPYPYPRVG